MELSDKEKIKKLEEEKQNLETQMENLTNDFQNKHEELSDKIWDIDKEIEEIKMKSIEIEGGFFLIRNPYYGYHDEIFSLIKIIEKRERDILAIRYALRDYDDELYVRFEKESISLHTLDNAESVNENEFKKYLEFLISCNFEKILEFVQEKEKK